MAKITPADLLNIDFNKKIKEDPRFKKYYEQLDDEQRKHVEGFVEEIQNLFMPNIGKFYEGLNSMSKEERAEFDKNIQQLNS
jgi:hypothetical protein